MINFTVKEEHSLWSPLLIFCNETFPTPDCSITMAPNKGSFDRAEEHFPNLPDNKGDLRHPVKYRIQCLTSSDLLEFIILWSACNEFYDSENLKNIRIHFFKKGRESIIWSHKTISQSVNWASGIKQKWAQK